MSEILLACTVNGSPVACSVAPSRSLADLLRDDLALTGTHLGCEQGVCGSCTVLIDGQPARACLTLAVQVEGRSITTIEGVAAADGTLHPLQRHLVDALGFQCGFCASGFVLSILGLADELPSVPKVEDMRDLLSGNLCRCTGYASIADGVLAWLDERRASEP